MRFAERHLVADEPKDQQLPSCCEDPLAASRGIVVAFAASIVAYAIGILLWLT